MIIVTNLNMKRAGVGDAPSRIERKRKRQCSESEVHNFVHLVSKIFIPNFT